jgi:RNA polymerase sigma factor (sigma-70 family)
MTDGPSETLDLLERWRRGDRGALTTLLERDLDWIRGFVHKKLGPSLRREGDTEDFVQELAMTVLTYGPRFSISDRGQFRGLLATIVLNLLRAKHRQLYALKRTPDAERPMTDSVLALDGPVHSVTRPESAAARSEEREWLRMGLLLLDADDQAATDLHWQGLTDAEIGARLGIAANTARMRRTRAVGRLAKIVLRLKAGRVGELIEPE